MAGCLEMLFSYFLMKWHLKFFIFRFWDGQPNNARPLKPLVLLLYRRELFFFSRGREWGEFAAATGLHTRAQCRYNGGAGQSTWPPHSHFLERDDGRKWTLCTRNFCVDDFLKRDWGEILWWTHFTTWITWIWSRCYLLCIDFPYY